MFTCTAHVCAEVRWPRSEQLRHTRLNFGEENSGPALLTPEKDTEDTRSSTCEVLSVVQPYAGLVFLNFAISLAIFPTLASAIRSEHYVKGDLVRSSSGRAHARRSPALTRTSTQYSDKLFAPISAILNFNMGDWAGRLLASVGARLPTRYLTVGILARLIFFPLFMFCNVEDTTLPVVFKSDAAPYLFMILLAVSNGYFGSLCMMRGPAKASMADREAASTLMVMCLVIGIIAGTIVSFGVIAIVKRVNPFV